MHSGRTKLAHVLVAVLLTVGLSVCWAFVLTMIPQTFFSQARRVSPQAYDELAVRSDGVPLVVTQDYANNRLETRHLDGAELDSDEPQQQIAGASTAPPFERTPEWSQRVLGFSASNDPTWWYLVHDGRADGHAYVVGFDKNSKRQIAIWGKDGFRSDELLTAERIPFRGDIQPTSQIAQPHGYINPGTMPYTYITFGMQSSKVFLLTQGNLVRMDLARRQSEMVYQAGDLQSISVRNTFAGQGLMIASTTAEATPPKRMIYGPPRLDELLLRTKDALLFADSEGNVTDRFSLPEELRRGALTAYLLPDRQCLIRCQWHDRPQELIWLQPDGKITARQELDLNDRVVTSVLSNPLYEAAVFPVPLAYGSQLVVAYAFEPDEARGPSLRESLPMIWLGTLLLLLISAALAVCCFRRQKQLHLGAAWGWAIFVLLIGIPGYLAYRFHRPWPTVDHCPRCHAATPVRTGGCANCEAEFPAPEQTGVEVFA